MSVEEKRGCGFRIVGGLYLVGGPGRMVCDRLPYPVGQCPTCGHGIKPSLGIRWMDGKEFFGENCKALTMEEEGIPALAPCHDAHCPICYSDELGTVGLMWVGESFYPTMHDFEEEAEKLGVSKRISSIPKALTLDETWILLVHPKGIREKLPDEMVQGMKVERHIWKPCIFHAFKPVRIEKIVTDQTPAEEIEKLKLRGITPVQVPHDDPDHNPKRKKRSPELAIE